MSYPVAQPTRPVLHLTDTPAQHWLLPILARYWETVSPRTWGCLPRYFGRVRQRAECRSSGLHLPLRGLHHARSSLAQHGASSPPVNSVFFHPSELGLYFDLGASSCRCLESSSALFLPLPLQCHPCLLAALDFRFCQNASRLGRQAPQLTVKSAMPNPSSGKKG